MAGSRRAERSPGGDHATVRTAWRLVACVPLVLLVVGLGVRAGLEADREGDDTRPAAAENRRNDGRPGQQSAGTGSVTTQSVGTSRTTLRRTFETSGKLTPREARERCEKAGIDPADLGSMSECIADLTE